MPKAPRWFPAWKYAGVRLAIYTTTIVTLWLGPSYIVAWLFGAAAGMRTSTFLGVTFFCGWLAWAIMELMGVRPWQLRFTFLATGFVLICVCLLFNSVNERRERERTQETYRAFEKAQKRARESTNKQPDPKPRPLKAPTEDSSYAPL